MGWPCPRKLKNPEANEIPDCVVDAWKKACEDNTKTAKTKLFNTWLQAGKDFSMLLAQQQFHFCVRNVNHGNF